MALRARPTPAGRNPYCWGLPANASSQLVNLTLATCPSKCYPDFDAVLRFGDVLNIVSLFCVCLVLLTQLLFRKKRRFPARLATNFSGCVFVFHSSIIVGLFVRWGTATPECERPRLTGAVCTAQGLIFQMSIIGCCLWWLVMSRVLHMVVVHRLSFRRMAHLEWRYHVVAWVASVGTALIGLATGNKEIGYGYQDMAPVRLLGRCSGGAVRGCGWRGVAWRGVAWRGVAWRDRWQWMG